MSEKESGNTAAGKAAEPLESAGAAGDEADWLLSDEALRRRPVEQLYSNSTAPNSCN
jgi:hypothetical protein